MPTTLCDLTTKLPIVIGRMLDSEQNLRRGRFREESLTDLLTGALSAFTGPDLVLQYPPEIKTGGDLDIEYYHVSSGKRLLLRLQAKRLSPKWVKQKDHRGRMVDVEVNSSIRSYKELLHKPKTSPLLQYKQLLKSAPPFVPLYMFYNHGEMTEQGKKGVPAIEGVNLAFAHFIGWEMDQKRAGQPGTRYNKRLTNLRKYFFSLRSLFCPPTLDGSGVPSPFDVADALLSNWKVKATETGIEQFDDEVLRKLLEPEGLSKLGYDEPTLTDGLSVRYEPDLPRPRLTFISGRSDDHPGPKIVESPVDQWDSKADRYS